VRKTGCTCGQLEMISTDVVDNNAVLDGIGLITKLHKAGSLHEVLMQTEPPLEPLPIIADFLRMQ